MSRIGKKAVAIPSGVTASVDGQTVKMKGPKGALELVLPGALAIAAVLQDPADGVDPLHGGDIGELAAAGVGGDFELQPRDVVCA